MRCRTSGRNFVAPVATGLGADGASPVTASEGAEYELEADVVVGVGIGLFLAGGVGKAAPPGPTLLTGGGANEVGSGSGFLGASDFV